jgi:hypothetical protein
MCTGAVGLALSPVASPGAQPGRLPPGGEERAGQAPHRVNIPFHV